MSLPLLTASACAGVAAAQQPGSCG